MYSQNHSVFTIKLEVPLGIEPSLMDSKSIVMPLDYKTTFFVE